MNRVKIIATIGPRTNTAEALVALFQAGMDIARLNGAHADLHWHEHTIALIRNTVPEVPILLDMPGRKIRIGKLDCHRPFSEGEEITFSALCDENGSGIVPVMTPDWPPPVRLGDVLLVDDGTLRFTVKAIQTEKVICRAENSGFLRSGKGIQIPGNHSSRTSLTQRDMELVNFALKNEVDFLGLSFVDSPSQVEGVKTLIGKKGPRIVAKIETQGAINHLKEIMKVADALMIDRGDLSVETGMEGVALLQKHILSEARKVACPVIVATEILNSMIENPTPTKAEISDITNAVLEGAAALMLSGETTVGKFPVEAVGLMRRVANTASDHMQESLDVENEKRAGSVPQAMADAIALLCRNLGITRIVAITLSGYAARMIAAQMPRQPILAISNDPSAARSFNLLRGTKGIYVDMPVSRRSMDHIPRILQSLWQLGELRDEDLILVAAVSYPKSGNRMNLIETHLVADLRDNLGWKK